MTGLYENCFPTWLRIMRDRIKETMHISATFEGQAHFDLIIALFSVSLVESEENVKKAVSKGLIPLLAEITNNSNWEQERYIHCLEAITSISL